ncbi:MAG: 4Fe-4S dicluster domain-containing protein [Treponema sp.]|jgi:iron only hydrogenase large subunit-like protein|nr:4Fe-4S dicluster domain-containing protein [Treponema sp.]
MPEYLRLKATDCKTCYKCIRRCPVKSIKFENNKAEIVSEECILCGDCFVACPQNAKEMRNDLDSAEALLQSGKEVWVSLAPSFAANFGGLGIAAITKALKKLGFAAVEETAVGATIVKKRYDAMVNKGEQRVIITTCCPTVNLMIQKYYPAALPYMAHVVSPMHAHCLDIKRRSPEAKTVFIGPCISKKAEAESDAAGIVDCVITFRELSLWLRKKGLDIETEDEGTCVPGPALPEDRNTLARIFPVNGGVLRTMAKENRDYSYLSVDGIENCKVCIEDIIRGHLDRCFIEMSACSGSCSMGPAMSKNWEHPVRNYIAINSAAGTGDFPVFDYSGEQLLRKFESLAPRKFHFSNEAIEEVLRKIGKTKTEHELNCGSCGYESCREKAQAVLEGKATLTMCLPYLKEKAENFSDNIIKNTPNAVVVLNENYEVQQINTAACRLFNTNPSNILGDQVVRIMDPLPFIEAKEKSSFNYNKHVYLADYRKHVEQTIIYDKSYHIIISIMRDITEEETRKEAKEGTNRKTIEVADRVIEKQMRTVQEIASLLGETAAETKIALTKLKESLFDA